MKRLIVNADDFGLTSGINRAILALHGQGVLTSSTLMASAPDVGNAAQLALTNTTMGVGCHVVLVDGEPVLPASHLPTLIDQNTGRFRRSLNQFVRDCLLGRIRVSEIEAEAGAQISRLRALGLHLTHLDTHKHTHMFKPVLEAVVKAAQNQQIRCIRNPFEPRWSLAATGGAPILRRLQVRALKYLAPEFHRIVGAAGMVTTEGAVGVLATGTLNAVTLRALLGAMPSGTWELVTHPGYNDASLARAGTRLLASRQVELDALAATVFDADVELIHFGQILSG